MTSKEVKTSTEVAKNVAQQKVGPTPVEIAEHMAKWSQERNSSQSCQKTTMSNKEIQAQTAADIKAHSDNADARRERQFQALETQIKNNKETLAEMRKSETERRNDEERRYEERSNKLTEEQRKTHKENFEREELKLKGIDEKETAAIEKHSEALEKQRDYLQNVMKNKVTENQEVLEKNQKKIEEAETKAAERVIKCQEKRAQLQEEINKDRIRYDIELLSTREKNAKAIEGLFGIMHKLKLEREETALRHDRKLYEIETNYELFKADLLEGFRKDQTERTFLSAVKNTQYAGLEVSKAMMSFGGHACKLRKGETPEQHVILEIQNAFNNDVFNSLIRLCESAVFLLMVGETNNSEIEKCQKTARAINNAIEDVQSALNEFNGSLMDKPIENSEKLFKAVKKQNKKIRDAVDSFPPISATNHAVKMVIESTAHLSVREGYVRRVETTTTVQEIKE